MKQFENLTSPTEFREISLKLALSVLTDAEIETLASMCQTAESCLHRGITTFQTPRPVNAGLRNAFKATYEVLGWKVQVVDVFAHGTTRFNLSE